ncbi:MAG: diguanylate cyclase [Pseudomonadota bacterium]|nr:MAG: diguanylate cyclase [Pseudomonadota bacterium]
MLVVLLWLMSAAAPAEDSVGRLLEQARQRSVTAPWTESEALLDEIQPRLDEATPAQKAEFWLIKARNQSLAGKFDAALETLGSLLNQPLTDEQRLRVYSLAANVAMLLRRWEQTFGFLSHALELTEDLEPGESRLAPFSLAAYVYAKIGETEQAIDYGQRGVEMARTHGNRRDLCIDQGRLAFVYKTAGMPELAELHYREALSSCLAVNDQLVVGTLESGLADLLRARGDYDRAEALFEQAISRLRESDWAFGLAEAQFYKARLHWERAEWTRAQELLQDALGPLEHDEAWDYLAEAHEMLGAMQADRGNHEQALRHMNERLEAYRRFLDLERARQLAHLQVAFDMRSREQELALLREQNRVVSLERESRRNQLRLRWLVYAFTAFLFVILALLLIHVLRERRHFRRLSRQDGLTGLSNHTRFFDTARAMIDQCHRQDQPLILILADIDYFKQVNDEHGHLAGDEALRLVADALRRAFHPAPCIGRIGGEEFAVCLNGADLEQALDAVETFRQQLSEIDYGAKGRPLTMSFGIAERTRNEPLEALRERADQALYEAKHRGRDSVVIAARPGAT